jgi:hypothetical protein
VTQFDAPFVFQVLRYVPWSRTWMAGISVTSAAIRPTRRIQNTNVAAPSA